MPSVPAPADPGWGEDPAWPDRDPMTAEEREAWLDRLCGQDDDPRDAPQEYWDPESCAPPPGQDELTGEELAGVRAASADERLALDAASTGRRGPGQAGSARVFPGQSDSRAAGFGAGMAWDAMPGCAQLAVAADAAVEDSGGGPGDGFGGVADQELVGLVCAWDRVEAHAAARKLVAIAEVFRRNPAAGLADRPGELGGLGPVDPWLARDLAAAAARNPETTWCVTVTDQLGHAVGHGCARPQPGSHRTRAGPGPPAGGTGFSFTPASRDEPPGGYGTWRLRTPGPGPDLTVAIDTLDTRDCGHRYQARGHDPGVRLRHLSQVRHATCTSPVCRRPASQCDFEHNIPYQAGGRSCLCNGGPKCRHDHRLKQQPGWTVDQLPDGTFRWTTPAGRSYDTEPTRYPI